MPGPLTGRGFSSAHLRALALLVLSFVASWLLTLVYLFHFDAPTLYLVRTLRAQDDWAHHFSPGQKQRLIVTGGSSATFSIDGGLATDEFHIPVINAGLNAQIGGRAILLEASRLTRPGDTVVLAFEPELVSGNVSYPQAGLQVLLAQGDWNLLLKSREVTGLGIPLDEALFAARPGLMSFSAFLGRQVTGTPFRYAGVRIKPGGLTVTGLRLGFTGGDNKVGLSPDGRALLIHFRDWAASRGVRIVGALPWLYIETDKVPWQRRVMARYVATMSEIMPMVRDETFGLRTDRSLFADTEWHLTEVSAPVRTRELIGRVLAGDFWTKETLARTAARL